MAITREDIIECAERLDAEGTNPTMQAIRDALGGGSFATISPVLREWKEGRKQTQRIAFDMPETVKEKGLQFVAQLWSEASDISSEKANELLARIEAMAADHKVSNDQFVAEIARLELENTNTRSEILEKENENKELGKENTDQKIKIGSLEAEITGLNEKLENAKQALTDKSTELSEMKVENNQLKKNESVLQGNIQVLERDLKTEKASLAKAQQATTDAETRASNLDGKLTAKEELIAEKFDQIQELKASKKELSDKLEEAQKKASEAANESSELNGRLAKSTEVFNTQEVNIKDLNESNIALSNKVTIQNGELEKLKKQIDELLKNSGEAKK